MDGERTVDVSQSIRRLLVKEGLYIGGLTVIIGLLTPVILGILTTAWNEQGLIYEAVWFVGYQFSNTDAVFIFPVAIYLGLLIIFSLDRMKKPQAAMLILGTVIATGWLLSNDLLIREVDWIGNGWVFVAGLLGGGILGGGRKLLNESWPHEFRRAPTLILLLLFAVLAAGLAEIHLFGASPFTATPDGLVSNPNAQLVKIQIADLIPNLTFSGFYLYIVDRFTQYDYKKAFMVLGPKRGGKTTLMTGAFHTADQMTGANAGATDNLLEYHQELINSESGFGNVDEPTEAGEFHRLAFNYEHGRMITKNIEVEAIDHGGEVLMDLKNEIDKVTAQSLWDQRPRPLKRFRKELSVIAASLSFMSGGSSGRQREISTTETSDFRTEAHEAVARSVVNADSLVITIPLVDYVLSTVSPENLPDYYDDADPESVKRPDRTDYLAEYDKILNWFTEQGGTDVYVVTTMSDLLLKEFEERKLNGSKAETESEYRRYEQWIKTEVLGAEVDRLLGYAKTETPLALHFEMNETSHSVNGQMEPNPVLEDGSVHFVNGDRLLRQLAS